jgi:hypothetical protein
MRNMRTKMREDLLAEMRAELYQKLGVIWIRWVHYEYSALW